VPKQTAREPTARPFKKKAKVRVKGKTKNGGHEVSSAGASPKQKKGNSGGTMKKKNGAGVGGR